MPKFKGDVPIVDIIMPTYNNNQFLAQAIRSVIKFTNIPYRLWVVNNGESELKIEVVDLFGKKIDDLFQSYGYNAHFVNKIELGENKGWMGGINAGIKYIQENSGLAKYVLFLNDDIQIIDQHFDWLSNMVNIMEYYEDVGAVGPISNAVMMRQNLQYQIGRGYQEESVLSGFCMLVRGEVIKSVGLLDENLLGGDDVDYSIRMRDAGWKLVVCRRSFVYHYYGQTGRRLHSDWDTRDWSEKIERELIRKHGLKKLLETHAEPKSVWDVHEDTDMERDYIRSLIPNNRKKVLDLGCGDSKIYDSAIGVDMTAQGEYGIGCGHRFKKNTTTDIVADISGELPFGDSEADYILAKHVLEHITDHVSALEEWNRILKRGGKLIIAVPDIELGEAMTCDATHVHVFNKKSLESVLGLTGYKVNRAEMINGAFSIIMEAEKV